LKIREITPEDLLLKNFKYEPVDLDKFKVVDDNISNMYYDNFKTNPTSTNYFQEKPWLNVSNKYFMNMKEIISINNSKIWTNFYPRSMSEDIASTSFSKFSFPSRFFKDMKFYPFDLANTKSVFKYADQLNNVVSFKTTFTSADGLKTWYGFYVSLKTNSDIFKLLSSIFVMQTFDNFIMSKLFTSFYLDVAKDLSFSSLSDFNFVYKTIGS